MSDLYQLVAECRTSTAEAYSYTVGDPMPPEPAREDDGAILWDRQRLLLPLEHMSDVGQFLPELATELATAQTTQDEEVEQKEKHLQHLKDELQRAEKERHKAVVANICSANRAISLAQDRAAETSIECQHLEKIVSTLISEGEGRKGELERVREERERQDKTQGEYRRKMAQHRERALLVEERGPVQRELAELERRTRELREKRVSYMHGEGLKILSGEEQRCLHNQVSETKAATVMVDQEISQVGQQVKCGEEHIWKLKKDLEMSQKRHQAQLTRLHRQLQEAQLRRRQWMRETEGLRESITQLQQSLQLTTS